MAGELGKNRFAHSGEGLAALADWSLELSGRDARILGGHRASPWAGGGEPDGAGVSSYSLSALRAGRSLPRPLPSAFRELAATLSALLIELREWSRMNDQLKAERIRPDIWGGALAALGRALGQSKPRTVTAHLAAFRSAAAGPGIV